jgi:hypothetical protein
MELLDLALNALRDPRTVAVFAMALLDLLLGTLGHSIRSGFSGNAFFVWLYSNMLKIVLLFALVLLGVQAILGQRLDSAQLLTPSASNIIAWVLFLLPAIKLIVSLIANFKLFFPPARR